MKRLIIAMCVSVACIWSISSAALALGVIDMQQVGRNSPQLKKIQANLKQQFAGQRAKIMTMGKALQANMQKYQKNKSVMSSADLANMKKQIMSQEMQVRQAQAKFQRAVYAAQNQQMTSFFTRIKGVIKTVAAQKKLDLVLPKASVLYSANSVDITPEVMKVVK